MSTTQNISKPISIAAKVVSQLFTPLIVPTYATLIALWGTYMQVATPKARIMVLAAVFAFSFLVPLIVICFLKVTHVIKDTELNERHERPIPYSVATVCYLGLWIYLTNIHAPQWFCSFFLASAIAGIVNLIVTFKWKISGHATGMGGLVAFTFFVCWRPLTFSGSPLFFLLAVGAASLVATARLTLERHTVMQIVAGFLTGIVSVALTQLFC